MAVPRRNGSSATALAAVLALVHFLLLATHSDACGSSSCPKPLPPPPCAPTTPKAGGGGARCPVNALKLGACASVLGGLLSLELGQQRSASSGSSSTSTQPCCQLLGGLADLDAALCLCTALRANVLGIVQLSAHVELSVLVNYCGKKLPQGFQCA